MKRLIALILSLVLLFGLGSTAVACNESQTNTYVTQILFGDNALARESDENTRMLLDALYLCYEQSNKSGQEKLNYLKSMNVPGVPSLASINLGPGNNVELCHVKWETLVDSADSHIAKRGSLLRSTVNKVFDFGWFNNLFRKNTGKCDSFAAVLYYCHILSDYVANDPRETEAVVRGKAIPPYSGNASVEIFGNKPSFSSKQKTSSEVFVKYSGLDKYGRAGAVYGCIGKESIESTGPRQSMETIKPSGWSFNRYEGVVNSRPPYVFNRCHLLAHSLGGVDKEINLITGTRYMNENGMLPYERKVKEYLETAEDSAHVIYRATPIYKGDNKVASGVQLEAYSIEDKGQKVNFNIYCYNIQPGIVINYEDGTNELTDNTVGAESIIPFSVADANENNPDLIFEMNRYLEVLLEDQKNSMTFKTMINQINTLANEARAVGKHGEKTEQCYLLLKQYQYEYLSILEAFIPKLLEKEVFFQSAFN